MSHSLHSAIAPIDRRGSARFALKVPVSTRLTGKPRQPARLLDISEGGCRLMTPDHWSQGLPFWLTVANLQPRFCHVMWSVERFAGVRFAVPLDEPVLRGLVDAYGALTECDSDALHALSERCVRLSRTARGELGADRLAELARDCTEQVSAFHSERLRARTDALLARLSKPDGA
ncbi:MAG: PilZ domain-containing protein [Pseudomonadota bacterium]